MTIYVDKDGKDSVALDRLVKLTMNLSNGNVIQISNPKERIDELLKFIKDPKSNFLHIGPTMINTNQIVSTECSDGFYAMRGRLDNR